MLFQSQVWGMVSGDPASGRSALHADGCESLPQGCWDSELPKSANNGVLPDMHKFHTGRDVLEKFLVSSPRSHTKMHSCVTLGNSP